MLDFLKGIKEVILAAMAMITAMISLVVGCVFISVMFVIMFLLFHPVGWAVLLIAALKFLFA